MSSQNINSIFLTSIPSGKFLRLIFTQLICKKESFSQPNHYNIFDMNMMMSSKLQPSTYVTIVTIYSST